MSEGLHQYVSIQNFMKNERNNPNILITSLLDNAIEQVSQVRFYHENGTLSEKGLLIGRISKIIDDIAFIELICNSFLLGRTTNITHGLKDHLERCRDKFTYKADQSYSNIDISISVVIDIEKTQLLSDIFSSLTEIRNLWNGVVSENNNQNSCIDTRNRIEIPYDLSRAA